MCAGSVAAHDILCQNHEKRSDTTHARVPHEPEPSRREAARRDPTVHASHECLRALRFIAMVWAAGWDLEPYIARTLRQASREAQGQRANQAGVFGVIEERTRKAVPLQFRVQYGADAGVREPLNVVAPLVPEDRPPEDFSTWIIRRPRRRVVDGLIGGTIRAWSEFRRDVTAGGAHRAVDRHDPGRFIG